MTLAELLANAQQYQLFLDKSQEQFDTPVWSRFLTDKYVSSLTWKSLGGSVREVAMGTIKDFSAEKPIRTRPNLSQSTGDIPSMGDQWQMTPRQLRDMLDIAQTSSIVGGNQTAMLLDYLFPEIRKAALAPQKRIDWILLQSLSQGQVVVDTTSNPDGLVWTVSWDITPTHVATAWTVGGTTATPLTDFRAVMTTRRSRGIPTAAILMNQNTWDKMICSTQINGVFGIKIPKQGGGEMTVSPVNFITFDMVNTYLNSIGLPPIVIIDVPIRIESSKGTSTAIQGFADDRVAFVPSLSDLGEMQWTYANEQRVPDKKKTYGTVNNVMIAQYLEKANFYTEYEFNAFPVLNSVNEISLMHTDTTT